MYDNLNSNIVKVNILQDEPMSLINRGQILLFALILIVASVFLAAFISIIVQKIRKKEIKKEDIKICVISIIVVAALWVLKCVTPMSIPGGGFQIGPWLMSR